MIGSMQRATDTGDQLCQMFYGVVNLLRDTRIRNGVAGYWLGSGSGNTNAAVQAHRRFDQASIQAIEHIMQRALDEGVMSSDIPAHDMARTAVAVWEGIVLPLRVEPFEVVERLMLTLGKTYFRAHGAHHLADRLCPQTD